MDGWSADQLKKMQLSGNGRLNGFLKQYGIDKDMDIKEKYNAKAAEASVGGGNSVACMPCLRVSEPTWQALSDGLAGNFYTSIAWAHGMAWHADLTRSDGVS